MKFTAERNVIVKALGHVARVVERRNTYPILSNVHITAAKDGVILRATDLDIEVTEKFPAAVAEEGITTVPAATLESIVRKFSDGAEVLFEPGRDEHALVVKSGRSRFELAALSPDSFPDLKSGTFQHTFSVPAKALSKILDKVSFAISQEETRYYLNGIYFHVLDANGKDVFRGVATDGHRMARCDIDMPQGAAGMTGTAGIIVPKKTIGEIAKLIDGLDGDVAVEISDTKIRIEVGNVVLLSKLIEGTFPDYDRVTPKNNDKTATISSLELQRALDRVSTIASERGGKAVKFTVDMEGKNAYSLELSVTNADHGTANEAIDVEWDFDGKFEIGFNARYAGDVLSAMGTKTVQLQVNDAGSPALFRSDDDPAILMILMPMRV